MRKNSDYCKKSNIHAQAQSIKSIQEMYSSTNTHKHTWTITRGRYRICWCACTLVFSANVQRWCQVVAISRSWIRRFYRVAVSKNKKSFSLSDLERMHPRHLFQMVSMEKIVPVAGMHYHRKYHLFFSISSPAFLSVIHSNLP